VNNTDLNNTDV